MLRHHVLPIGVWEATQRAVAVALLPVGLMVAILFGLLIQVEARGPIFIAQEREGYRGRRFRMLKLRTMVSDAESVLVDVIEHDEAKRQEWLQFGRLDKDPRIAGPLARIARRFSIDELPQLINVFRGEMLLVGPRPLPIDILDRMDRRRRLVRQRVRPGVTGLWQVSGRSDLDIQEIGRIDECYVMGRTFCMDMAILLRTIGAVTSARGAY